MDNQEVTEEREREREIEIALDGERLRELDRGKEREMERVDWEQYWIRGSTASTIDRGRACKLILVKCLDHLIHIVAFFCCLGHAQPPGRVRLQQRQRLFVKKAFAANPLKKPLTKGDGRVKAAGC